MRSKLNCLAAALLLTSSAAVAADLPSRKSPVIEPVIAAPAFSWTGFYVGAQLGGAWNNSNWSGTGFSFNTNGNGFLYGAQAGYNYQMGSFVAGLEGDIAGVSVDGKNQCSTAIGTICQTKQNWLGSINGRLGYAIDRFMVYGTGGVAFTNYKFDQIAPLSQRWGSGSRTGWTAGLGAEYAFTNNWTAGLEWKYYGFGSRVGSGGISPASVKFRENENTLALKVNYKF